MKVAIYSRVSTTGRGQEAENQVRILKEYCKNNGHEIISIIKENISGDKLISERRGMQELFSLCHSKKIDMVLFFALDRLTRRGTVETLEILKYFDSCNVKWHSYSETYLSTANAGIFSTALISILSTIAEQEKVRIRERIKCALERKKEQGIKLGRPTLVNEKKVIELRKQGLSYALIAEQLGISKSRAFQLGKVVA